MNALKEKVSDQLSRLFANSPNSAPPSPHPPPDNHHPANQSSAGRKSSSSYFSFGIPSLSFVGHRPKTKQHDLKPTRSLPVRFSNDYEHQDDYSPTVYHECNKVCGSEELLKHSEDDIKVDAVCEKRLAAKTHTSNEDCTPGSYSADSDIFEETCDQLFPSKPLSDLMDESAFISSELFEFLKASLPNIVKGCRWILMYSTLKHGTSLQTLIRKSAELSGPCLLIAGDRQGAVFGGMLQCPFRPTAKRKYQGTHQSFVFTTVYGEPRLFKPTGANRYYYMCLNDVLAIGGGSNFALRLDGDLLNGTSGPSETFGNRCLAHAPEFELKNVELWGFTHASRYQQHA